MKFFLRNVYSLVFVGILTGCSMGTGVEPSGSNKLPQYINECNEGKASSCFKLGNMYKNGIGTLVDLNLAKSAYKSACQKNMNLACLELGKLYIEKNKDTGVRKILDNTQSKQDIDLNSSPFENVKQLCDGGDYEKCFTLGKMYEQAIGTRKNYSKAFKVYKKSCERSKKNTMQACYALGTLYNNGLGIRRSYRHAIKLFNHTCNSESNIGCAELGDMYLYGRGGKRDYLAAAEFLEKGCTNGNIKACTTIGTLFVTGEGVAEDYTRAHYFFNKACLKGDALACFNMGNIYENGIGRAQNKEQAKVFYSAACKVGLKESCISLESLK